MQNNSQKSAETEKIFHIDQRSVETRENQETRESEKNLREATKMAGEGIEGTLEGINFGTERVSEKISEHTSENGSSVKKTQHQTSQVAKKATNVKESADAIKARLLNSMPTEQVMKREIKTMLDQDIHQLLKKARLAEKKGNAFELNKLVAKIREIKDILASIAHATYEMLKNLWLKVVHGIS
ncbi:hypothetical protein HYV57_04430 [Candidatus Peregrinibacteria bacterium]|nr:hypothetical protein [Candidatus Peregrinibacteria bacterium]